MTVCDPSSQYQTVAPDGQTDRECATLTVCGSSQFETKAKTTTSDRECQDWKTCDYGIKDTL